MVQNLAPIVYATDLESYPFQPTIFLFIETTFVGTSTTFVNATWQSAGWTWWPVLPLFSRRYCECSISTSFWFQCFRHGADLQIDANRKAWIQNRIEYYFHKWFFPYLLLGRKCKWKREGHQKEQPCRVKPHGTPNTTWAKSPSKCVNISYNITYNIVAKRSCHVQCM